MSATESPPIFVLLVLLTVGVVGLGFLVSTNIQPRGPTAGGTLSPRVIQRDAPSYVAYQAESEEEEVAEEEPEATEEPEAEESSAEEAEADPEPIELAMQEPPGAISGWVVSEEGEYIPDAEIELRFENLVEGGKSGPDLRTVTGNRGTFEFDEVPPGIWTLVAEHPGYAAGIVTGLQVRSEDETERVEVIVPPAVELKGTVRTTTGINLESANIRVYRQSLRVGRGEGEVIRRRTLYRETTSNRSGEFTLERIAPGTNVLVVSLAGFATERVAIDVDPEENDVLRIEMTLASSVGGVVRSSTGTPIQGATVELTDPQDNKFKVSATSRRDGSFLIPDLRSEYTYRLRGSAPNYAPSQPVEVQSGRLALVVVLEAGGSITGRVIRQETELPEGGVGIRVESADENSSFSRLTRTSSDGTYRFGDLPGGSYNLRIVSERLTSEPRLGVKVETPKETRNVNFTVYPGQTIRGTVAHAATRERIPNATVTLNSKVGPAFLSTERSQATTDEGGHFEATNLPYGLYTLEASADGYLRHPGPEATADVDLVPGTQPEPVELLLAPGGVIKGVVRDASGTLVEGARVQVFNTPGARTSYNRGWLNRFTETTDSGGRFEMDGIPLDQEVNVTVSASVAPRSIPMDASGDPILEQAQFGRAKAKSEPVVLTEFLSSAEVRIDLETGGIVRVTTRSTDGTRLEDVNVNLGHNGFPGDPAPDAWSARTGGEGRHVFSNIPRGGGRINASKQGYLNSGANYSVEEGGVVEVTIELEPATTIAGYVVDDGGNPVTAGHVDAIAESGARGGGRGQLNNRGRFEIHTVSEGTFRLRAVTQRQTQTGRHEVWQEVRGARAGGTETTIVVPMRGALEGLVQDKETALPINANVSIRGDYVFRENGATRRFSSSHNTANPPGRFSFQNIPPATYTVTISAGDYLPETVEDVEVQSPGTFSIGTVQLTKGASVTATVVSARTGEPIQGARLTIDGPTRRGANTNAQGRVRISSLPEGMYSARVEHGEYLPTEQDLIQVSRFDSTDIGTLRMDAGGSLWGKVTDGSGRPVTSALVTLRYYDEETRRTARTDGGGIVRMNGLEPGAVMVSVTGNFRRGRMTKTLQLTISERETTRFDVELAGELTLNGSIAAAGGRSITGPKVDVYPLEADGSPVMGGRVAATISGNTYRVEDLLEGRYLIAASGLVDGELVHWTRTTMIAYPGATVPLWAPNNSISGRVRHAHTGEPMANLNVRLRGLTFPQSGVSGLRSYWEWNTTTDEDGFYRFRSLDPGEYEIVVTEPGTTDSEMDIISLPSRERDVQANIPWNP